MLKVDINTANMSSLVSFVWGGGSGKEREGEEGGANVENKRKLNCTDDCSHRRPFLMSLIVLQMCVRATFMQRRSPQK